jgi:hypothetical protein
MAETPGQLTEVWGAKPADLRHLLEERGYKITRSTFRMHQFEIVLPDGNKEQLTDQFQFSLWAKRELEAKFGLAIRERPVNLLRLAAISALVGAASGVLFVVSLLVQLALGPYQILGRPQVVIGFTAYGAYLSEHGFSMYAAGIMDKLMQSILTTFADLLGVLAIVLGVVALVRGIIRKERIGLAVIGIITGSIGLFAVWGPLVIDAFY